MDVRKDKRGSAWTVALDFLHSRTKDREISKCGRIVPVDAIIAMPILRVSGVSTGALVSHFLQIHPMHRRILP